MADIDRLRFFDESIIKNLNLSLKQLLKDRILHKPKFEQNVFPLNAFQQYVHRSNPCKGTL